MVIEQILSVYRKREDILEADSRVRAMLENMFRGMLSSMYASLRDARSRLAMKTRVQEAQPWSIETCVLDQQIRRRG